MYELLKYTDEVDKSLGIAGMAIALLACDGENFVASVSVDQSGPGLEFAPEAFFAHNPRFSAKIAWNQLMREFHVFSGMLLGNVMCRHLVTNKNVQREIVDILHELISAHGGSECSLENDELDEIFNKDMVYFRRLFSHPAVADVARDFAGALRAQRSMTAGEVFEHLSRLNSGF